MEIKRMRLSDINLALYNPRKDLKPGDPEYEKLKRSVEEFDCVEPLVWNRRSNRLIGGHQRLKILKEKGIEEFEVSVVDLEEQKEKALNVALNKIEGDWDFTKLADLMTELDDGEFDLELTGFDLDDIEEIMNWTPKEEEPFDAAAEAERIKEPKSKRGEIYRLGRHRLMCGDATSKEDVERLVGGEKADMVFCDPPYGIDYQDLRKKFNKILNDKESDIPKILKAITRWENIPYYICCNWQSYPLFFMILKDLIDIKALIVWDKKRGVQNLDKYYKRHEFIIYSGAFGSEKTIGSDVWELNREVSDLHPTMKPVELCGKAISNSSRRNDIIVDLYGGSGSTLMACEQLNRQCRMMEIDEIYTDVIINRWQKYTGDKAELIKQ